jgi:uncharacterized protein DUF6228
MRTCEIRSASDGAVLVLGPLRGGLGGYYLAELRTAVVAGKVEVYDEPAFLGAFFAELAGLWWKGWEGERRYESIEEHLTLVATRDSRGRVGHQCRRGHIRGRHKNEMKLMGSAQNRARPCSLHRVFARP